METNNEMEDMETKLERPVNGTEGKLLSHHRVPCR